MVKYIIALDTAESRYLPYNKSPHLATFCTRSTAKFVGVASYGISGIIASRSEGEAVATVTILHISSILFDSRAVATDAVGSPIRIVGASAAREPRDCVDSASVGAVIRYAAVHLAIIIRGRRAEIETSLASAGHEQDCCRSDRGETETHLEGWWFLMESIEAAAERVLGRRQESHGWDRWLTNSCALGLLV